MITLLQFYEITSLAIIVLTFLAFVSGLWALTQIEPLDSRARMITWATLPVTLLHLRWLVDWHTVPGWAWDYWTPYLLLAPALLHAFLSSATIAFHILAGTHRIFLSPHKNGGWIERKR